MRTNIVKCVSQETKNEIYNFFEYGNVTKKALAEAYGVSVRTIGRILKEMENIVPTYVWDYSVTKNEITIFRDGIPKTISKGFPDFKYLKTVLIENHFHEEVLPWVYNKMDMKVVIETFSEGNITVDYKNNKITYGTFEIKHSLVDHIFKLLEDKKDALPMVRFLDKLMENPKEDIVEELYGFMQYTGIEIADDGDIIAFKGVKNDYTDKWTGTIDNSVGCKPVMPRNEVDYNPSQGCSSGLHTGSYQYAYSWGQRLMKVKINPKDVVSVPYDCNSQKMRCCTYEVIEEVFK